MLTMTAQEQLTLDIIAKISTGKMRRKEGQKILNVSERTLRRHLSCYAKDGPLFVKHGNYNKDPVNITDPELKKKVLDLVREKYFDFNLTHCLEKLKRDHEIEIKREIFRQWCHEIGMVKKAKRRSTKVRRRRDRMAQTGIMLRWMEAHIPGLEEKNPVSSVRLTTRTGTFRLRSSFRGGYDLVHAGHAENNRESGHIPDSLRGQGRHLRWPEKSELLSV